jgi:hypothetical protein
VWWVGDSDEETVEEELSGGSAQAWREGVKGARRAGGGGSLLYVVGWWGRRRPVNNAEGIAGH